MELLDQYKESLMQTSKLGGKLELLINKYADDNYKLESSITATKNKLDYEISKHSKLKLLYLRHNKNSNLYKQMTEYKRLTKKKYKDAIIFNTSKKILEDRINTAYNKFDLLLEETVKSELHSTSSEYKNLLSDNNKQYKALQDITNYLYLIRDSQEDFLFFKIPEAIGFLDYLGIHSNCTSNIVRLVQDSHKINDIMEKSGLPYSIPERDMLLSSFSHKPYDTGGVFGKIRLTMYLASLYTIKNYLDDIEPIVQRAYDMLIDSYDDVNSRLSSIIDEAKNTKYEKLKKAL